MRLNKQNIRLISPREALYLPSEASLNLTERVLQFGTGVLLRALPDFYIDQANQQGIFNGSIVIVKSTAVGDAAAFHDQDGLYTVCIRGVNDGKNIVEDHILSSVSRVISANEEWADVLACAIQADIEIVISNTTEIGLKLLKEDIHQSPPETFPAKLTSVLYHRYCHFKGDMDKGWVIIPTELITANGDILKTLVFEIARHNGLDDSFLSWLEEANEFCNSLVDRIVPGFPKHPEGTDPAVTTSYSDNLMVVCEPYSLWAIESRKQRVIDKLSFALANNRMIIDPDINKFRELKLRVLNGAHTFCCGLAMLAGFTTVSEAMADKDFSAFVKGLVFDEIIPAITGKNISDEEASAFAANVIDRFSNQFIEHKWEGITMQYSSKMLLRNVPVLLNSIDRFGYMPPHMALGFAAHLLFMRSENNGDGLYYNNIGIEKYLINDLNAGFYAWAWRENDPIKVVERVLQNAELWNTDLSLIADARAGISFWLNVLMKEKTLQVIRACNND